MWTLFGNGCNVRWSSVACPRSVLCLESHRLAPTIFFISLVETSRVFQTQPEQSSLWRPRGTAQRAAFKCCRESCTQTCDLSKTFWSSLLSLLSFSSSGFAFVYVLNTFVYTVKCYSSLWGTSWSNFATSGAKLRLKIDCTFCCIHVHLFDNMSKKKWTSST